MLCKLLLLDSYHPPSYRHVSSSSLGLEGGVKNANTPLCVGDEWEAIYCVFMSAVIRRARMCLTLQAMLYIMNNSRAEQYMTAALVVMVQIYLSEQESAELVHSEDFRVLYRIKVKLNKYKPQTSITREL